MKKLLIVACTMLATKGFSQGFVSGLMKKLEFGLKAGGNMSNFSNASFATDPLYGFHAGATIGFKITDHFLIQEDILFSTQGAKITNGSLEKQDLKLTYMALPILLKYRTTAGFFIEAGPQFSMKLNEKIQDWKGNDFAKKVDLAAAGGIGYQSPLGLGISARYVYGLSKVGDFDVSTIKNDFKNNTVQASIFYVF